MGGRRPGPLPVWWPRRSISTTLPASLAGTVPVKCSPRRSIADSRVVTVMPLPLALTVAFAFWTTPVVDRVAGVGTRGTRGAATAEPGAAGARPAELGNEQGAPKAQEHHHRHRRSRDDSRSVGPSFDCSFVPTG